METGGGGVEGEGEREIMNHIHGGCCYLHIRIAAQLARGVCETPTCETPHRSRNIFAELFDQYCSIRL